jgi:hypothetical protein
MEVLTEPKIHDRLFNEISSKLNELEQEGLKANPTSSRLEQIEFQFRRSQEELALTRQMIEEKMTAFASFANPNTERQEEMSKVQTQLETERAANAKLAGDLTKSIEVNLFVNFQLNNLLFEKYFSTIYGDRWLKLRESLALKEKQVLRTNLFIDKADSADLEKCNFLDNCFWKPEVFSLQKNNVINHINKLIIFDNNNFYNIYKTTPSDTDDNIGIFSIIAKMKKAFENYINYHDLLELSIYGTKEKPNDEDLNNYIKITSIIADIDDIKKDVIYISRNQTINKIDKIIYIGTNIRSELTDMIFNQKKYDSDVKKLYELGQKTGEEIYKAYITVL